MTITTNKLRERERQLTEFAQRVEQDGTHYEVLGVPPGSTPDVLRIAWLVMAAHLHPDRCKLANAHDLMARVNKAYATLSDPAERKRYDMLNLKKVGVCATCKGSGFVLKQKGFRNKVSATCPSCGGSGLKL